MWQQQPNGSKAASTKRTKSRNRMHLKRVSAQVKAEGGAPTEEQHASVILNDFSEGGLGLFTHRPFIPREIITLVFEEPLPLNVKAKIVWCQMLSTSTKVISETSQLYRVGLEFVFENDEQKEQVKKFCAELIKLNILGPGLNKKAM